MTRSTSIMMKISFIVMPIMFFFSNSFANEMGNSANENDSIYKYNALENKIIFFNSTNDTKNLEEKLPENNSVVDDAITKLQEIIKKQNSSIEKSESDMYMLGGRNRVRTFFLGHNVGILKYQIVQIKDQNSALSTLARDAVDNTVKNKINNQIDILKQQQEKVENFIEKQDDKFSLFGWLVASL